MMNEDFAVGWREEGEMEELPVTIIKWEKGQKSGRTLETEISEGLGHYGGILVSSSFFHGLWSWISLCIDFN
jgi:hypothetical protein